MCIQQIIENVKNKFGVLSANIISITNQVTAYNYEKSAKILTVPEKTLSRY